MDAIQSVSEFAENEIKNLEEFAKAQVDPGYTEEFASIQTTIVQTQRRQLEEFWKKEAKFLRNFLNARGTLNAFSSTETIHEADYLGKDSIPEAKEGMTEFISTVGAKLHEPFLSAQLNEILDHLDEFIATKVLKDYKFTIQGLRLVKALALNLTEELKKVRPQLYSTHEKKIDEMIKFVKSDKNVQFQLYQKLTSIQESTITEETKVTKGRTAIQNFGYLHLKPKEAFALYDAQVLL